MSSHFSLAKIQARLTTGPGPDGLLTFAKHITQREIYLKGPLLRETATVCLRCKTACQHCPKPALHRDRKLTGWYGWETFKIGDTVLGYKKKKGTIEYIGRYSPQDRTYPCLVKYEGSGRLAGIRNIATLNKC